MRCKFWIEYYENEMFIPELVYLSKQDICCLFNSGSGSGSGVSISCHTTVPIETWASAQVTRVLFDTNLKLENKNSDDRPRGQLQLGGCRARKRNPGDEEHAETGHHYSQHHHHGEDDLYSDPGTFANAGRLPSTFLWHSCRHSSPLDYAFRSLQGHEIMFKVLRDWSNACMEALVSELPRIFNNGFIV